MLFGLLQTSQLVQMPKVDKNTAAFDSLSTQQLRFQSTCRKLERQATVTDTIEPGKKGQIAYQGSWWTARSQQSQTFQEGQIVYVIARNNLTLYVESSID